MCPRFLQGSLCIAEQSVAPFPRYLNEDRLLPHWPDPGGRYGQDRPPGPRTEEQVRRGKLARHGLQSNSRRHKCGQKAQISNLIALHQSCVIFLVPGVQVAL